MANTYTARAETEAVVQDWNGMIIGPENTSEWAEYQKWLKKGGVVNPVDYEKPFLMPIITRVQFFHQAVISGFITEDEALLAVQIGSIPGAFLNIANAIDNDSEEFKFKMVLSGATKFQRENTVIEDIRLALGMTHQQMDEFFLDAAQL